MIRVKHALYLALFALSAFLGCGVFGSKNPRVERFVCLVRALEPAVGDVLDAEQLAKDLYTGKANMNSVATALRLTQAQIDAYNAAADACDPPLPQGEPS